MLNKPCTILIPALLGVLLVVVLSAIPGEARTITVDDDGPADHSNIKDAITDAQDGDTISVYEGTYYENVVVNKSVNLIGNGSTLTTIDGEGHRNVVLITTDWVNMSGFTVMGSGHRRSAIKIESSYSRIFNNTCTNSYHGILIKHSNTGIIANNNCSGNNENGIWLISSHNNTLTNNSCSTNDCGIHLSNSANNIVSDNICSMNEGCGIRLFDSTSNTFTYNRITENKRGIHLYGFCRNNNAHYNNISGNTAYGISGPGIDATCNWWGHTSGPYHPSNNSEGKGDKITDQIHFEPWFSDPIHDRVIQEKLSGYIADSFKVPLEDVKIRIEYDEMSRTVYSNKTGYYSISHVRLGNSTNRVIVSRNGYRNFETEIEIGENTILNVTLEKEKEEDIFTLDPTHPVIGALLVGLFGFYLYSFHKADQKYALLSIMPPLYTKLRKDKILDQKKRQYIYRYLSNNPGANYTSIKKELNLGTSSLVYHLKVLQREGFIRSRKEMGRRIFHTRDSAWNSDIAKSNIPLSPMQTRILNHLMNHGPAAQTDIEKKLSLKQQSVSYSINKLQEKGLVQCTGKGKGALCRVIEELQDTHDS